MRNNTKGLFFYENSPFVLLNLFIILPKLIIKRPLLATHLSFIRRCISHIIWLKVYLGNRIS